MQVRIYIHIWLLDRLGPPHLFRPPDPFIPMFKSCSKLLTKYANIPVSMANFTSRSFAHRQIKTFDTSPLSTGRLSAIQSLFVRFHVL